MNSNKIKLNYKCNAQIKVISAEEMTDLLLNLKKGKASGLDNLTAEHLYYEHPIVAQLLTKLLNFMLIRYMNICTECFWEENFNPDFQK